jgi:hypothetical protein
MSMIGNLVVLSQEQLNELLKHPELIEQFLYPSRKPSPIGEFFKRLFGGGAKEKKEPSLLKSLENSQQLSIDKAWHVLHFLFTGSAWEGDFPSGFLCSAGETVGDNDVGYGPARWFDRDQVAKISDYLQQLDDQKLREKLVPEQLVENDIYPSAWDDCDVDDEWAYCYEFLSSMRAFLLDAKMKRMALIVYLN